MTLDEHINKLEEALELEETKKKSKKHKKPYDSITYTTGDIQKNIDHFNKMLGGKATNTHTDGMLNGSFKNSDAEVPVAASPDGASDCSGAIGGDAGGCCEALMLDEDKIFAAKMGDYIELPPFIHILPKDKIESTIRTISPEEPFKVGYVTPVYFYKKLLDRFTLIKCTEMIGFTGIDYREASTSITGQDVRIQNAEAQISNPMGYTDYGFKYNKENNKVKSATNGMRKSYGDINKTVNQNDNYIYEVDPETGKTLKDADKKPIVKEVISDLKTILFYPLPHSKPTVSYYIDLKNGKGYQQIGRDMLVDTLYKAVFDLIKKDRDTGKIEDEEDMTDMEITFLHNVTNKAKAVIEQDAQTIEDKELSTGAKPNVRALYTNQLYYISSKAATIGASLVESYDLTESKRYVRRYFMKPQNKWLSNKDEVLKALIDHEDEDCVIYTLINQGDTKDEHKLTSNDIIYYYEDGILYDKNHVRIMDYELSIKHEEERPHIEPDQVSDAKFADVYMDRMTGLTDLEEDMLQEATSWANTESQSQFNRKWADIFNNGTANGIKSCKGLKFDLLYKGATGRYSIIKHYTIARFAVGQNSHDLLIVGTDGTKERIILARQLFTGTPVNKEVNGNQITYKASTTDEYLKNRLEIWIEDEKIQLSNERGWKLISGLSDEEAEEARQYFANNIKSIEYKIPCGDAGYAEDQGAVSGKDFAQYAKKFKDIKLKFEQEFPAARGTADGESGEFGPHITYKYILATDLPQKTLSYYDRVGKVCLITFKQPFKDMPLLIQNIINGEKNTEPSQQMGAKDVKPTDTVINSVVLGQAIMELFNYDVNFLAKAPDTTVEPAASEQIEEPFNLTFESLHEGKENICCICGEPIDGYGNNPEPYHSAENDERCCDACNLKFVIPARLAIVTNTEEK